MKTMKIRYPVIISIAIFIASLIVSDLFGATRITEFVVTLWLLSLLWVAYAIIAKLCRTIYRAAKNRANRPEKSPLEP
jgi:hypothetical protein